MKKYVLIIATLLVAFVVIYEANTDRIRMEPTKLELPTEQEEPFTVAVMTFTPDEARDLLQRFEDEREAERRAEEQRRIVMIQHGIYSASYFKRAGRIRWNGWDWTYYSERILPGYGLRIPGRHTDALGYVRDGNGYLCLASDVHRRGAILETPFGGYGKVYDCGCGNNYTIDVYVGW